MTGTKDENLRQCESSTLCPVDGSGRGGAMLSDICVRTVGERLLRLRKNTGLTLEDVARLSEISRAELSRIEKGERRLSERHLFRLSQAYRIPLPEMRDILSFQFPARPQHVLRSQIGAVEDNRLRGEGASQGRPQSVGCCRAAEFMQGGVPRHFEQKVVLPVIVPDISPKAYAIVSNSPNDIYIAPNTLILVDPHLCVRVGDLVINTVGIDPMVIRIHRDLDNLLCGRSGLKRIRFEKYVTPNDFHKIVAILPAVGMPTFVRS